MQHRIVNVLFTGLVAGTLLSSPVMAQVPPVEDPGHPRVNQVDNRLENQENHIQKEEQAGKITPGQAARDEKRDARIQQQAQKDEAKHGGHLTKREDRKLNREMNHTRHNVRAQKHADHRMHKAAQRHK